MTLNELKVDDKFRFVLNEGTSIIYTIYLKSENAIVIHPESGGIIVTAPWSPTARSQVEKINLGDFA